MAIDQSILSRQVSLRHLLHQHPELSDQEESTAERIVEYLKEFQPDEILTGIGGAGVAAIFAGAEEGPTVLFRCELDALPIHEVNDNLDYRSEREDAAHKCGHDGHMAIVAGLAPLLARGRPKRGRVVLLFQPSEETGEGAERMLDDEQFGRIAPDFCFAFHNLPKAPLHRIIVKRDVFTAASTGMVLELTGAFSHAAHPEDGRNPFPALAAIAEEAVGLPGNLKELQDFTLVTLIHARVGEVAFGTNPGEGVLMLTLRAYQVEDLERLKKKIEEIADRVCREKGIEWKATYRDEFTSSVNNDRAVDYVVRAAEDNGFDLDYRSEPFRWSDDFGYFTHRYPGAFFCIGSGTDHPQLHNSDYDFPDDLIETGMTMFNTIINSILDGSPDEETGNRP